jgi:tetratricopeptide (TPR) repeat protein
MQDEYARKNFFAKLFDISFRDFITPTIVSVVYVIMIALCALTSIFVSYSLAKYAGLLIANTENGRQTATIIIGIISYPIVFFLGLIQYRVLLELIVALFRIAQNTTDMLRTMGESRAVAMAGAPAREIESPPADLLERARWLHTRGRAEEAVLALKDKLRLEPDSIPALDYLGVILEQKRDYKELLAVLEKLTAIEPQNVKYMEHMARIMKIAGKP